MRVTSSDVKCLTKSVFCLQSSVGLDLRYPPVHKSATTRSHEIRLYLHRSRVQVKGRRYVISEFKEQKGGNSVLSRAACMRIKRSMS